MSTPGTPLSDPLSGHARPPHVSVVGGEVVIMGGGVSAAYTPEAAQRLAEALMTAARQALDSAREPEPVLRLL
ncbi:hypothetical protein GGQ87_000484 [Brevundimonas alba]|uniref:Uncharacterized protein n=1 Tax=Brevundimonas alba TaxID=74314 RepID=A0A7X5YHV0_9CAUL|nr:hypothetical protein [Brevundimonas alba]NJC40226.1 hypothetical protein [Brevundimonas alba]